MLSKTIFLYYLDIVNDFVPADELGKNWEIFAFIASFLAISLWVVLIIYLLFFRKFRIRYFVDGVLVHTSYYKKKENIEKYSHENVENWYLDEECTKVFTGKVEESKNYKLFAKTK